MTTVTARRAIIREYDEGRFPFPLVVTQMLRPGRVMLPGIHEVDMVPANPASDQDSLAHRMFYAKFAQMEDLYREFVRDVILPLHDCDLCVQRVPTFRVARPGGVAVSEWHTDAEYSHQAETVNYWVPVTQATGTATVWLESEPGRGDYAPADMDPGEYLEFPATVLRHGNQPNDTGRSRVSFDFRVIRLADYRDAGSSTVAQGVRLRLGDYYTLLTADGEFQEVP